MVVELVMMSVWKHSPSSRTVMMNLFIIIQMIELCELLQ